jgi:hypothetical protein
MVIQLKDGAVGILIQQLDFFTLHIDFTRCADNIGQAGPRGMAGNQFGSHGHIVEDSRERAGGIRKGGLLVKDVPLNRNNTFVGFYGHLCPLSTVMLSVVLPELYLV